MSEVLHANIFFIISSVATVLFAIGLCFILFQVYKILKLVRSILERVENASEVMAEDMRNMRDFVAAGKGIFPAILGLILGRNSKKDKTK